MTVTDNTVKEKPRYGESPTGTCEAANLGGEGVRTDSASGAGSVSVHCAEEDG
ncbi:hypothetical protein [Streptomyces sp. JHA26]|uniref:hypothetical protein n=1 Tax=Streptomyces sp. JHA26 TaxID=1917143 RepID=UPI0015C53B70|nr:hypothetical protein [Streptomyces sp. JHA26]